MATSGQLLTQIPQTHSYENQIVEAFKEVQFAKTNDKTVS